MKSIDKFFKDKLENHSITPPENAWTKVEARLSKKNNVVLWRWAAAVLLMGALVSIIFWSQNRGNNAEKTLVEKTKTTTEPVNSNEKPEDLKNKKNSVATISKQDNLVRNESRVEKLKRPTSSNPQVLANKAEAVNKEKSSNSKLNMLETEKALAQQYTIKLSNNGYPEEKNNPEATPKSEVASSKQKSIKLEFTLEDLPSEETVATTNEAKPTGIKKVLNLAREMKQGEGPVSNLREKKDELLAHNFLTKKERNQ